MGHYKLNTDGASTNRHEANGIGGVFHDSSGNWVLGFAGYVFQGSILELELKALLRGLKLALHNQLFYLLFGNKFGCC